MRTGAALAVDNSGRSDTSEAAALARDGGPAAVRGRGLDLQTIITIAVALAVGGFVKGATGTGLPMVAVPVMAAFIGVPHAVAVMAIPTLLTNLWLVWSHRGAAAAASSLVVLLATGVLGVFVGTWGLVRLDDRVLSLILAGLICGYIALILIKPAMRLEDGLNRRIAPGIGFISGGLQGATGISGPIVVTYAHARRLDREAHVFTVSAIYGTFAVIQTPALIGVGILTPARLAEGALALIPILGSMWLGTRLGRAISERTFSRLVIALLVLMAIKLVHAGLVSAG